MYVCKADIQLGYTGTAIPVVKQRDSFTVIGK